ncbi:hypothetical protein ACI2L1_29870 [Streptomyces sp. NPDC019531]|uniref:hypothetical protein n=1 Tax=Streptomyces sp. NPDC019531 TaxID=3365062 RepID=UPI00384CDFEB
MNDTALLTAPAAVPLVVAGAYGLTGLRTRRPATTVLPRARQPVPAGKAPVVVAERPEPEPGPEPVARLHAADWAGLLSPAVILTCGSLLAVSVLADGPRRAYSGLLRADALTAWMLLVVGAVALIACGSAPAYLAGERAPGGRTTVPCGAITFWCRRSWPRCAWRW